MLERRLALYEQVFERTLSVCQAAAKGDLSARIAETEDLGDLAALPVAVNKALDLADAYVRESGASLEYASRGKFFRAFLTRGMLRDYCLGAETINAARLGMEKSTREAAESEATRRRLEAEEKERVIAEAKAREERVARIAGLIRDFEAKVERATGTLDAAVGGLRDTAEAMVRTADRTSSEATAVAAAAEQTTTNVETVAAAAEQLSGSVREIGR